MTQNKIILGFTSSIIVIIAFIYIIAPFEATRVYASEKTFLDTNENGIISGKIQTSDSHPLSNVPITIDGFNENNNQVKIGSITSDPNGNFTFKINKGNIPVFQQHKIIIYFTIDGKTFSQTFYLTLDNKTFVKLFVDHKFLPSPPFTVFAY